MPLKRRRGTDPIPDTIVVETQDGVRLRCSISVVGRETEPRWMIIDENGEQFVGPVVTSARSADDVGRLIQEWWPTRNTKTEEAPRPQEQNQPPDR